MRRVFSLATVFAILFALTAQLPAQSLPVQSQSDKKKDPDAIGDRDVSKGVNFYSIEKELALGKQLSQMIEKNEKVITDPVISEYINRLGQNIARHSDTKIPLTVKVIEGDSINAITLPGGFFYVNTELILTADNEAELAGAMAHEIAHIAARHGTRQMTRAQIGQLATIPLIFMGGWAGVGAQQASRVIGPLTLLGFERSFESEADLLGLQYLYKAGYDPAGMVDIFEKIDSLDHHKPGKVSKFFSTHPLTGDRIVTVQKNIQELLKEQPEYVVTTSEFNDVKARLIALERAYKPVPADPKRPTLRRPGERLSTDELVASSGQQQLATADEIAVLKQSSKTVSKQRGVY